MEEKARIKRRKKRKLGRNIAILSIITAMIVIVSLSIYQSWQPIHKKPADEYFSFSEAYAIATPMDEENSSIKISQVGFNITAVEGDATNGYIRALQGMVKEPEHFDNMTQGESKPVGPIEYSMQVVSNKTPDGWPVDFDISCREAKGKVTVYIVDFIPL